MRLASFLIVGFLASPAAHAAAPEAKPLGTFGKWTAYTSAEAGKPICYAVLKPAKTEGDYKARGDVMLTVTHRPAEKAFDVVSVVAGYQYQPDSDVAVNVGGKSYALFTSSDRAWARDAATDKQIVQAMTKAVSLTAKGVSNRKTPTTDMFTLTGFPAAYRAINESCKKPAG
jgi:hypothetical protein